MIYIISCKSSSDRLEYLYNKIKTYDYIVVDYFDMHWLKSWNFLFSQVKDQDSRDQCKDLSDGELGCYLAHIESFRIFLESEEEFCTVFEDDVELPDNWQDIYLKALDLCIKGNIHYCCLGDWGDFNRNVKPEFIRKNGQYTRCCHAHIINRIIVKYLYNNRFPVCRPLDFFINYNLKKLGLHDALHYNPGFAQRNLKSLIKNNIVDVKYHTFK